MVKEQTFEDRLGRSKLRRNAKRLRTDQTDAEWKFWHNVRAHRFAGYKFKRQYPVGPYIADFVCLKAKLIVELDGDQHALQRKYDEKRDAYLRSLGFRVRRFGNVDVLTNIEGVLESVWRDLQSVDTPSP